MQASGAGGGQRDRVQPQRQVLPAARRPHHRGQLQREQTAHGERLLAARGENFD